MLLVTVLALSPLMFGAAWWVSTRETFAVVDMTRESPKSKRHPRTGTVDAVVLHQTGFSRGNDPSRYTKVTAHFVVLPNGTVLQLHPLSARLSASDGLNGRSVSIEFVGNFQALNGKWWRPEEYGAHMVSLEQIEAGRALLRALAKTGVRHVFAHRQSSASRGNDPGPEIWRGVGDWGVRKLGLSDGGPNYAIDDGAPIPDGWRTSANV